MGHSAREEQSAANGEGAISQSLHNKMLSTQPGGEPEDVNKHVCADTGVSSSKTWGRGQMFGLRKTLGHNYFLC